MAKIIAIAADKGGTGKTTTTYALAVALAKSGYNVYAVDLDPQANLTKAMVGLRGNDIKDTLTTALSNGQTLPVIEKQCVKVVPTDIELSLIENVLQVPLAQALRKILSTAIKSADFILFDCPPGASNTITFNALSMSDYLILPVTADGFCVDAVDNMLTLVKSIPTISMLGILVTMQRYNGGNIYNAIEKMMRGRYGELVFKQTIRHSVKIKEKLAFNSKLLPAYYPTFYVENDEEDETTVNREKCSLTELDYIELAKEILSKFDLNLNLKYNL